MASQLEHGDGNKSRTPKLVRLDIKTPISKPQIHAQPISKMSEIETNYLLSESDAETGDYEFFTGGENKSYLVTAKTDRSILCDLKAYALPEDIKNKADNIFNQMHYRTRRGKKRVQLIFYCVYCAHLEFGLDVNPNQLGAMFKLTPGEVQKCDSLFAPLQTGYKPRSTITSPLRYLPDYCKQMELTEDAVSEISQLANDILRKEPGLFQENPQTVAAGILKYYTETYGILSDDPQKIPKVTGRSNVTIDGIYRRISTIDNS
jgi:transcription initiation factor TFIIIB Brf1 subunit/transcription initiation factor TFIIB